MTLTRFAAFLLLSVLSFPLFSQTSSTLASKDLAIAMPLTATDLIKGTNLFPKTWYQEITKAFGQTSVGSALETESPYTDWRLISLRIAPCAPLGQTPTQSPDELCWPEVRLVWQPVLRKIRLHERYMEAAADDRAVHAIYPLDPDLLKPFLGHITQLSATEKKSLIEQRQKLVQELVPAVRLLRDTSLPASAFTGYGTRVEADDDVLRKTFLLRLQTFLNRYTPPAALRTLTAFSLPEGREPAHLDEWVFLAFKGENSKITPDSITIRSAVDGRLLADLGPAIRGSQNRDEDSLYDLLDGSTNATELSNTVMLRATDITRLKPLMQDRQRLLVPNTSCISCHKLNDLRFDLHNFSYLEDRELTVSPRVKRDVELDLLWLGKQGY